jgi:class 3 adenylate cyclase
MSSPLRIGDFIRIGEPPPRYVFHLAHRHRLAIVETIGDGYLATWGFTIWEEGHCIKGQCSVSWSADEACRRAREWLAKNPEEPR